MRREDAFFGSRPDGVSDHGGDSAQEEERARDK